MRDAPDASRPPASPPPPPPEPAAGPSTVETFDETRRPLAPAALTAWRIGAALAAGPPLAVVSILALVFLDGSGWLVLAGAVAVFVAAVVWLPSVRHARWSWQLTGEALALRHGVVVRAEEFVPYFRIQQIDVTQGPIDRLLGLATLQVTTASSSGSVSLPGLSAAEAPEIRIELLARAAEAVGEHEGELRDAV